jgi:hypothetical protein
VLWCQYGCLHTGVLAGGLLLVRDDGHLEGKSYARHWGEGVQAVVAVPAAAAATAWRQGAACSVNSSYLLHIRSRSVLCISRGRQRCRMPAAGDGTHPAYRGLTTQRVMGSKQGCVQSCEELTTWGMSACHCSAPGLQTSPAGGPGAAVAPASLAAWPRSRCGLQAPARSSCCSLNCWRHSPARPYANLR